MTWLKDKLDGIRHLVRARHLRILARIAGLETLTLAERSELQNIPLASLDPSTRNLIEEAYKFGRILSADPDQLGMTRAEFDAHSGDESETPGDEATIEAAKERFAQSVRRLGSDAENDVVKIISGLRREAEANMGASRESIAAVSKRLRTASGDWWKDWDLVASTEIHSANQYGYAEHIRRLHGDDVEVFKRPMKGACRWCVALHLGSDGHPRIFKLSDIEANGLDNSGRHRHEWEVVVGSTHPSCGCMLIHLPTGWGFDESGHITPNGKGGKRFSQKSLHAAMAHEALLKSHPIKKVINFQGMEVCIENEPGSIREWDEHALNIKGKTRMLYNYGYIAGTKGADNAEYDCFVGPNPDSPYVFIAHQAHPWMDKLYDEDKAMLGFDNVDEAKRAYLIHYESHEFLGSMSMMSIDEFKEKVYHTGEVGGLAEDGMVKSDEPVEEKPKLVIKANLNDALGAYDSPMGDRAVSQGSSGPNIAWGVPHLPVAMRDPTKQREFMEAYAEWPQHPNLFIDGRVYNFRDFNNWPLHPLSEWEERAAYQDQDSQAAAEFMAYLQERLDRRLDFVNHGFIPTLRDQKDQQRFFITEVNPKDEHE